MTHPTIIFLSPAAQVQLYRKVALFIGNKLFQLDIVIDRRENCLSCSLKADGKVVFYIDYKSKDSLAATSAIVEYGEYAAYCEQNEATPTDEDKIASLGVELAELIAAIQSQIPEEHWEALADATFTGKKGIVYPVLTSAEVQEEYEKRK